MRASSIVAENDDDSIINCDQSENESSLITEDDMKDKLVKEQVRRDANNARERYISYKYISNGLLINTTV